MLYLRSTDAYITLDHIPIHDEDRADIRQIRISGMTNNVPSKTYWVRRWLIRCIAPVTVSVVNGIEGITGLGSERNLGDIGAYLIAGLYIYMLVVTLSWILAGRPNFREYSRRFVLIRIFLPKAERPPPKVWSVLGPIPDEDDKTRVRREPSTGPQPLSGIRSFFRSTSPLDDLLCTFEATRWMTDPIRRTPRSESSRHDIESLSSGSSLGPRITINANVSKG